jgi:hypothetical protein
MKNKRIKLKQKLNWIQRMYANNYFMQGLVQFDQGELTICGDSVKWLDELQIYATSNKKANKIAFEFLNEKYPEYGIMIQLF